VRDKQDCCQTIFSEILKFNMRNFTDENCNSQADGHHTRSLTNICKDLQYSNMSIERFSSYQVTKEDIF